MHINVLFCLNWFAHWSMRGICEPSSQNVVLVQCEAVVHISPSHQHLHQHQKYLSHSLTCRDILCQPFQKHFVYLLSMYAKHENQITLKEMPS